MSLDRADVPTTVSGTRPNTGQHAGQHAVPQMDDTRFAKLYGGSSQQHKEIEISSRALAGQLHQLYLNYPTPQSAHQHVDFEDPLFNPEKFRIPKIQERRPGDQETIYNSVQMRDSKLRSTSRAASRQASRSPSRAVSRSVSRSGSSMDLYSASSSQKKLKARSIAEFNARAAIEREEAEQPWMGASGLSAAEYLTMDRNALRTRASTASMVSTEAYPCGPGDGGAGVSDMYDGGGAAGGRRQDVRLGSVAFEGGSVDGSMSQGQHSRSQSRPKSRMSRSQSSSLARWRRRISPVGTVCASPCCGVMTAKPRIATAAGAKSHTTLMRIRMLCKSRPTVLFMCNTWIITSNRCVWMQKEVWSR